MSDTAKNGTNQEKQFFLIRLFNGISIIKIVNIGYVLILVILLSISIVTYFSLADFQSSFTEITEEAEPLVKQADEMEKTILSAHNALELVLNEHDLSKMPQRLSELRTAQNRYKSALDKLTAMSQGKNTELDADVGEVTKLTKEYQLRTEGASGSEMGDVALRLMNEKKSLSKATSSFESLLRLFGGELSKLEVTTEDDFVKIMTRSLVAAEGPIEINTGNALKAENSAEIKKLLESNKKLLPVFQKAFKDVTNAQPGFKETIGYYIEDFELNTSSDKGILAKRMRIYQDQEHLFDVASKANKIIAQIREKLTVIQTAADSRMKKSVASSNVTMLRLVLTLVIGTTIGILIGVLIAAAIGRIIRVPLDAISRGMNRMAKGDLSKPVPYSAKNEFGTIARQLNALRDTLVSALKEMNAASDQLRDTAHQNRDSVEAASASIQEQQNETNSVASAMTEMDSSVVAVSESANGALQEVIGIEKAAEDSRVEMSKNISTIHDLSNKLTKTSEAIKHLSDMGENIDNIIGVIKGVADQTSLLALNAAIEAARAGEHGRGFAVVADEVRTLADQTAKSTKDVSAIISELMIFINQTVDTVKECSAAMEASVQQSSDANGAIEEMQAVLIRISNMSSQVAHAADEQKKTSENIVGNINRISTLSNENNSEISKISDTCGRLEQMAVRQDELLKGFKF